MHVRVLDLSRGLRLFYLEDGEEKSNNLVAIPLRPPFSAFINLQFLPEIP